MTTELRATHDADRSSARTTEAGPTRPVPDRRLFPYDTAWIAAMAAGLFVLYATVSLRLHARIHSTGFDLGLNEQAVRSWAHGHLPIVELEGPGFHQLGDHFAPILATIAPIYRIFPTPITLLVTQAALVAVAVVPLAGWALRALGRPAAVVVGLGYGLSWGVAELVGFDFHEVAFAVPMMAFSAVALGERRYRAAVLWALPMVLVKEDLGVTVAVVGGLVAWGGRRALGLATIVIGLGATCLEVLVIIPANTPGHSFSSWRDAHLGPGGGGPAKLAHAFSIGLITPETKAITLVMLLAPTVMLALRSKLVLLAVPTLLWRLGSNYWPYWGTYFHYNAVLMPVMFAAFIDAMRGWPAAVAAHRLRETLLISAAVTALSVPSHQLWSVAQPKTWHHDQRVDDARAVLAMIPDGATVAASNRLAAQLAGRTSVSLLGRPGERPNPEWLVVETAEPVNWPFVSIEEQQQLVETAQSLGYQRVMERGNDLLLHRSPTDSPRFPPANPA